MECSHYKQKQIQNHIWQCSRLTICCMVLWLVNRPGFLDTGYWILWLVPQPGTQVDGRPTHQHHIDKHQLLPGSLLQTWGKMGLWNKAWSWDGGAGIKRCNSTSSGSHSISWSMKGWYKPVGVDIEVELKVLTDKFIIQPAVFVVPLQYIRSNWLALYSALNERKQCDLRLLVAKK